MAAFFRNLKSDGKRAWPYILLAAILDFGERLVEHRLLGDVNNFIDAHSGPIIDGVRPILIWLVHTPFVLLVSTVCVILLHAFFSSRRELQHNEGPTYSLQSTEQPINLRQQANPHIEVNPQFHIYPPLEEPGSRAPVQETKASEQNSKPPSHNIVFLGGHRYNPNKHGLLGGPRESDMMRFVLAEFRNKHIVGSNVGHVYDVRAGVTYRDDKGTEVAYVSPCKWLRHDADTVELESGAMSEFVVLAAYNYHDRHWETHKVGRVRHYMGDVFCDEPIPLPLGKIVAEVVLLERDGNALEGGAVTFELKANGEFAIL